MLMLMLMLMMLLLKMKMQMLTLMLVMLMLNKKTVLFLIFQVSDLKLTIQMVEKRQKERQV